MNQVLDALQTEAGMPRKALRALACSDITSAGIQVPGPRG
jgi:hypothetical protein